MARIILFFLFLILHTCVLFSAAAEKPDEILEKYEDIQQKVGEKKYSNKIVRQIEKILEKCGPAFASVLSEECLRESVAEMLKKFKPAEVRNNFEKWNVMIQKKNFDLVKFWNYVLHCEGFCSLAIAHLSTCYMNSVSNNYLGYILFDYGESHYKEEIQGGWWSNHETFKNRNTLEKVVNNLRSDKNKKVYLHARASTFGDKLVERARSIRRGNAVKNQLIKKGISKERIRIQVFGWEPPHIDNAIAKSHGFVDEFTKYSKTGFNQSVLIYFYE